MLGQGDDLGGGIFKERLIRLKPQQIKKLRQRLRVSQPVFARYLNTSELTIENWETGAKQPSGMALKLLSVVQKHGLEALV